VRLLQYRLEEANHGAEAAEQVEINDVIEWCLISPLTIREVPLVEQRIPGVTAALSRWLESAIYELPDL